ncbi:hypothetical protein TH5_02695 [Thalassospira xianhensis MCCC 1A02616]|uniref:Nuclease n=1 Tax=Thalassospira xianhensis MCCC 1A02616 TaxID=1177929 RepID=A0A367UG77_9PROT|nr:hypothetical protein TH5_02695 [Thalassospira xianhensis MCCC 1A02616]
MLACQSISRSNQTYSQKSGNFAANFAVGVAGCLFAASLAVATPAHAQEWICGPAFDAATIEVANVDGAGVRGGDLPVMPVQLARFDAVDALIISAQPDVLWRLADIAFVPEFENAALEAMQDTANTITGLIAYDQNPDFAGRRLADMRDGSGMLWQEKLLEQGVVILLPEGDRPIDTLIKAEQSAMTQQAGLWANSQNPAYHYAGSSGLAGDLPDAAQAIGRFAVIDGILERIEDREWRSYLNFGANWRDDFTVMIDRDRRDAIAATGQHMEDWIGRKIRVRGLIEDRGGPYLELVNPASLCVEQSVGQP